MRNKRYALQEEPPPLPDEAAPPLPPDEDDAAPLPPLPRESPPPPQQPPPNVWARLGPPRLPQAPLPEELDVEMEDAAEEAEVAPASERRGGLSIQWAAAPASAGVPLHAMPRKLQQLY